ncbi:MAG: hypothetical protein ACC707_09275 [Thiohalomonadales bacterium]
MTRGRGKRRIADLLGIFVILGAFLTIIFVAGCSSTDKKVADDADATPTAGAAEQSGGAFGDDNAALAANEKSADAALEDVPETVAAPRVVETCKKEPYIKYESASRASIKVGWAATKSEQYGVGFKDAAEYKKWSSTHNALFKRVTKACETLSKCAQAKKKDKKIQCVEEATVFRDLQNIAKTFASNVKEVETSQVIDLCAMKPNLDDSARCFDALATNIRAACDTEECAELAQCWQNIYFMDAALRQAETSCRFARQKLSKCRGYSEQIGRRKAKLAQCSALHEAANIHVLPVL